MSKYNPAQVMSQQASLLLVDTPVLDASLLLQVSQKLGTPLQSFLISTTSFAAASEHLKGRTFSNVVSLASTAGFHASGALQGCSSLVSPGGRVLLQEPSGSQV